MSDRETVMTINPSTASFEYEVPVDPMDDLQCESCQ